MTVKELLAKLAKSPRCIDVVVARSIFENITNPMLIIDQDLYNTDGNGVILIVEREDHLFAEAASPTGDYIGQPAETAIIAGAPWLESPNDVIEAWYSTFHDGGQLIRPNSR